MVKTKSSEISGRIGSEQVAAFLRMGRCGHSPGQPWELAERLTEETGKKVIAARDGMTLEIDKVIGG